ncbi:hypothetical protein QMP26_41800 (plasmid) [Enterocloster clostridioformis]
MNAKIEELEELINRIIDISLAFSDGSASQEDQIYCDYEPEYRRFFDVVLLTLLGIKNFQIPGYSMYIYDLYYPPGTVDTFHRTLLKSELGKLNWDVQFLHFTPEKGLSKIQDEETRNFIEETMSYVDVDFCYDYFNDDAEYLCIILENKEIVKRSGFWDKELRSKRDQYLSYIDYLHDYCLGSYKEVGRDRVRYCLLVTEFYSCNDVDFPSINMYYCTPVAIIAARLLDDLCKAEAD